MDSQNISQKNNNYKVLLNYTDTTRVEGCFWKYFLSLCGFYIMDLENNVNIDKTNPDSFYLYICTEEELEKVKRIHEMNLESYYQYVYKEHDEINLDKVKPYPTYIYFVKGNHSSNEKEKDSVFYFNWQDKNSFKKILSYFHKGLCLEELFDLFWESGIWEAAWLNDNHPNHIYSQKNIEDIESTWKEKIILISQSVQKKIQNFNNENYSVLYFNWYCKYLELSQQTLSVRSAQSSIILKNIVKLYLTNQGFQSPLNQLLVNYYKLYLNTNIAIQTSEIPKREQTNEIRTILLYNLMVFYGEETAYELYHTAFKIKPKYKYYTEEHYYAPLIYYTTGIKWILNKNSDKFLNHFSQLFEYLHLKIKKDYTSMEELVFMYRCLDKINQILLYKMGMPNLLKSFENIVNELEKENGFKALIDKMTPLHEQEERNQELLRQLRNLNSN